jgi:transcriptional regulator with PAS, ATPase and Fis domain
MAARLENLVPALPTDADGVLQLAAQTMFDVLARDALGLLVVDRQHRIVWISEGYKRFLPALGFDDETDFVGRQVSEVIPNTQMDRVIDSGQPMIVDLLSNKAGTFLVSRLPLRDATGEVIGALGMVLLDHPETSMQPLMIKFGRLQKDLDEARAQLAAQRRSKYTIASYIGASPAAFEVKRQARRMAASDATVLLLGETGTGKELLAHAIHAASARAAAPFIGVNIAAVPDTLLEAEFFGVAPGAYTGADRKGRDGKFKLADGGTLFLDEIGDMPLALQAKLLRVLQEQEVEPLGSNRVERVDVRVIAATSRDLGAMVAEGGFRADLYYRLNVLPLRLPPLRERLDDIPALAEAFAEDIVRRSALSPRSLAADALAWLARQRWPGNIRELRNVLEQSLLMTDDDVITAAHFEAAHPAAAVPAVAEGPGAAAAPAIPDAAPTTLADQVASLELAAIRDALAATGGNRLAAAKQLKISRATLYERLARYPELNAANPGRRARRSA